MSDDGSDNFTRSEQAILFVELLAKHEILLGNIPTTSPNIYEEKERAAAALCKEFNAKCEGNLTAKQVLKRICNIRTRLKLKNFKNYNRTRKLKYTDAEKLFLDIWLGGDITVPGPLNKTKKSTEWEPKRSNPNPKPSVNRELKNHTLDAVAIEMEPDDAFLQATRRSLNYIAGEAEQNDGKSFFDLPNVIETPAVSRADVTRIPPVIIPEVGIPPDVGNADTLTETNAIKPADAIKVSTTDDVADPLDATVKIEADDYEMQDNSEIPSLTRSHFLEEDDSETKTPFEDKEDKSDKYESVSLDELKRIALIAQIKNLNEQRAAARAKKQLDTYKLKLLRRSNVKNKSSFNFQ